MKTNILLTIMVASIMSAGMIQAQDATAQNGSAVVAEINGTTVTQGQLDKDKADTLFNARRTYYTTERKALESLIDQMLLEMQARKEHVTVDELIERHVTSQIKKDPTDDQLQIFYDSLETDQPFSAVRGEILRQLRQIRISKARAAYIKSLREQAKISVMLPEPRAEVALDGKALRGPENAPVRVVEFADYQCPYCRELEPQLERLKSEFGDKVAFAFMDFPLPMHAHAQQLAEAADCAGAQGKFWEYHDFLFKDLKEPFDASALKEEAKTLNLDTARFDSCLDSSGEAAKIKKDMAQGKNLGITGTPTVYINGRFESGNVKYDTLRDIVQQELSGASAPTRQSAQR